MSYTYLDTNSLFLDIYLSCCNTDNAKEVWKENQESLLFLIGGVSKGVSGQVMNEKGEAIQDAVISHDSSPHFIKSFQNGAFWIALPSGSHVITVSAPGHIGETRLVVLPELLKFTHLKFQLQRDKNVFGMPRLVFVFVAGEILLFDMNL